MELLLRRMSHQEPLERSVFITKLLQLYWFEGWLGACSRSQLEILYQGRFWVSLTKLAAVLIKTKMLFIMKWALSDHDRNWIALQRCNQWAAAARLRCRAGQMLLLQFCVSLNSALLSVLQLQIWYQLRWLEISAGFFPCPDVLFFLNIELCFKNMGHMTEITAVKYSLIKDFYFWRGKQLHYSLQSKYKKLQRKTCIKNSQDGLSLQVPNYFPEQWEYFMKSKGNCFLEKLPLKQHWAAPTAGQEEQKFGCFVDRPPTGGQFEIDF